MKKQDENIQEGKSLDSFSRDVIHTNKMPQRKKKKKKKIKFGSEKLSTLLKVTQLKSSKD